MTTVRRLVRYGVGTALIVEAVRIRGGAANDLYLFPSPHVCGVRLGVALCHVVTDE
jgi:hypothetical protein